MTTRTDPPILEEPSHAAPGSASRTRRRRRPTGAPAPLPHHIGASGKVWLLASAILLLWLFVVYLSDEMLRLTDRADSAVLRAIAEVRVEWLTEWMDAIDRIGSGWAMTAVAMGLVVALLVFRRWRHLFTLLASVIVLELIGQVLYYGFSRPRPFDVTIIGRWGGFSLPAAPIAVAAFIAVGVVFSMVPAGRSRNLAKVLAAAVIAVFAAAELYLATFHPSDILVGVTLAVAIPLNAFRWFTPNDVFPVKYKGGKTAHLDVGGRRGEALRQAIQAQLGFTVVDIQPVGLAGSGGSTPLLITVEGSPNTKLFGKLYAMSHVRADRWYKLGRTILYGRLEDESPFRSVRRLVLYEDYALRFLQDAGVTTAVPYGIVEITPEREYLLLTEFFDGAEEIGDATVDDQVIDEGLTLIRQLWDVGVAHRDIKPANLLVRDRHVLIIDVAFMQIRPSPWREAIDLANMMLVLAVRTDPERVYERALAQFSPDEIAEAFAATRGVASPSQLRTAMKGDGRDLLGEFRSLAPERPQISLQRWSFRRVGLAVAVAVAVVLAIPVVMGFFAPAHDIEVNATPSCGTGDLMVLMAQAVPSATSVPCVATLPAGWEMAAIQIRQGQGRFWLNSDIGGRHAIEVEFLPAGACAVDDATEVPSDEVGMRRYEQPEQLPPNMKNRRTYLFEGGCVTYMFEFAGESTASLMFDADSALAFQPRSELVDYVASETGLRLCGAGAKCPGGGAAVSSP